MTLREEGTGKESACSCIMYTESWCESAGARMMLPMHEFFVHAVASSGNTVPTITHSVFWFGLQPPALHPFVMVLHPLVMVMQGAPSVL